MPLPGARHVFYGPVAAAGLGDVDKGQDLAVGIVRYAYCLALRLRQSTLVDGALRKFLNTTLGAFVRIRPDLFLTGLSIYGSSKCREAIYTDAAIFTDRFAAVDYELQRRLDAIQAVRNSELVAMREKCGKTLSARIKITARASNAEK